MISRLTLRRRMILLFCLVVGTVAGGIYIVVYSMFNSGLQKARFDRMVDRAQPLIFLLQYPEGSTFAENLDLRRQYFEVYDANGKPLFKSKTLKGHNLPPVPFGTRAATAFDTVPSELGSVRRAIIPIKFHGEDAWFVAVEVTSTIDGIEADVRKQFLIFWCVGMVLVAFLARWYVARSLKPILLLTQHAEELTRRMSPAGAYNANSKLEVRNPFDEVGRLATNFNVLFERVGSVVQQMRRFVSDAAHELRTPLAVVRGETQLLLSQPRPVAEYQRTLVIIDNELATMGRIMEGLFTLAMADAGQLVTDRTPVHLDEVLEEACGVIAPLAREKHISIKKSQWCECLLHGDQTMLRQLFLIFIDNAVKYSHPYTTITVELYVADNCPTVVVQDEGIGIRPEHIPHIFRRFYRAAPQTSEDTRSGGLGLAIASAIVSAHHAFIECESTVGVGSRFTVTFPIGGLDEHSVEDTNGDEKAKWIRVASTLP